MFRRLIMAITLLLMSHNAFSATQSVLTIAINGIACPFCINVLLENVKKQAFTSDAKISNDDKELIVSLKPGTHVDMDKLNKVIRDSGYEPVSTTAKNVKNNANGEVFSGHVAVQNQPCNTCHQKK